MMGRPGSGRARKASMSFPRSATKSGAGVEDCRPPGLDIVRDLLTGAILGVAERAGSGEALVAARDIVGDSRECGAGHDRFVGRDINQVILRIDTVIFDR